MTFVSSEPDAKRLKEYRINWEIETVFRHLHSIRSPLQAINAALMTVQLVFET